MIQAILDKNPGINECVEKGQTLDIVLINVPGKYAIAKVSPEIRKVLMSNGKLYLGMRSHRIRDHFQPLQCFACQVHGHKQGSTDCKHHGTDRKNTCLYCSGDHMSKDCPVKKEPRKYKCANCAHSDKPELRNNCCHTSTSLKCPFVIKEINALLRRTAGISDMEAKNLRNRMSLM